MPSLKICSVCEESVCFNTVIAVAHMQAGIWQESKHSEETLCSQSSLSRLRGIYIERSEKSSIFTFSKLHGVRTWGIVIRVFAGISWKHGT